jgi:pimeloyl-ACP methyl ester carboxylesterase
LKDIALSSDGVPIHYAVLGEGLPALVFVHGWSCDQSYWKKQVSYFARLYKVVTIDLAGHGESGLDRKSWTMEAFGSDVAAVVEKLGLGQVVLIGHSMGGTVIVEAAKQMPQTTIGLIVVETFKDLDRDLSHQEIAEILTPFRKDFAPGVRDFVLRNQVLSTTDPVLVESVIQDMGSAPPDVAIPAAEYLFGHTSQVRRTLQKMDIPVVLIQADYKPTNVEAAERCGISVEIVSGVSHFLMLEAPDAFNHRLEKSIKDLIPQGDSAK